MIISRLDEGKLQVEIPHGWRKVDGKKSPRVVARSGPDARDKFREFCAEHRIVGQQLTGVSSLYHPDEHDWPEDVSVDDFLQYGLAWTFIALREQFAALAHEQWINTTRHMLTLLGLNKDTETLLELKLTTGTKMHQRQATWIQHDPVWDLMTV